MSRRQSKPPTCRFRPLDTIEFNQLRSDLLTGIGARITASKLVSTSFRLCRKRNTHSHSQLFSPSRMNTLPWRKLAFDF
jgi:hypothetical protein